MSSPSYSSKPLLRTAGAALLLLLMSPTVHAAEGAVGSIFQWRPFLAPFHAVVLHYPIGFLTLAFLLEIYRYKRPSIELQKVTTGVIVLSLLSGFLAASLGILRASGGGYESKALDLHRWFGLAIPFLTLITLGLQMRANRTPGPSTALIGYRASLTATLVVLVVAGHYGGNLTHGSKYLVENAPQFIKEFLEEEPEVMPARTTASGASLDPGSLYYLDKVRPIFEAKCIRCHGPEKQKAGYRLDQKEIAFKGGESGEVAIKAKEPMRSNLVRLIMLPRDHDDVMPPDGKEPLTPEEVMTIVHWIQSGASYPEADPAHLVVPGVTAQRESTNVTPAFTGLTNTLTR